MAARAARRLGAQAPTTRWAPAVMRRSCSCALPQRSRGRAGDAGRHRQRGAARRGAASARTAPRRWPPSIPATACLPAGGDSDPGIPLRRAGERLRATDLAAFAAAGLARVIVREPRVRVVPLRGSGIVAAAARLVASRYRAPRRRGAARRSRPRFRRCAGRRKRGRHHRHRRHRQRPQRRERADAGARGPARGARHRADAGRDRRARICRRRGPCCCCRAGSMPRSRSG